MSAVPSTSAVEATPRLRRQGRGHPRNRSGNTSRVPLSRGAHRLGQTQRSFAIVARRFQAPTPPSKDGPRVNEDITSKTILLIGDDGHKYGEIGIDDALAIGEEKGFDLVEVSPGAKPPVVKLMDYGKYKYEQQKKAAEARKHQKIIEIKEIKMRPMIDDHDYDVKMRAMKRFFEEGDKVKVTLRFRGREMAHQHLGMELLTRIQKETDGFAKIEAYPRLEGRQMMMVLAPK
jgi:translation initiation factor IF-3